MASNLEITGVVVGTVAGINSIISNPTPINIINNAGQIIAGTASLLGPGGILATAGGAAGVTAGTIATDLQTGQTVAPGDILALTNDVVMVVGGIGDAAAAVAAGGVAVAASPGIITAATLGLILSGLGLILDSGTIPLPQWPGNPSNNSGNNNSGSNSSGNPSSSSNDPNGNPDGPFNNSNPFDPNSWGGSFFGPNGPFGPDGPFGSKFKGSGNIVSPLILDLNGDGVKTLGLNSNICFDQDNNGFAELTGWVDPSDGLLVLDKNNNGKIDNGAELFGDNTILSNGNKAANGFSALAELDSNRDNKIDASDTAFNNLHVWKDSNSNGVTDAGELIDLATAGVKSINLNYDVSGSVDAQNNTHQQVGSYTTTNNQTRSVEDIWFATDLAYTKELNNIEVSAEIAALPDIAGFGNVHSLHQALAKDVSINDEICSWELAA